MLSCRIFISMHVSFSILAGSKLEERAQMRASYSFRYSSYGKANMFANSNLPVKRVAS